ncbi:hypothetical protein LQ50_20920 [Halalkalibacter okhensis]|uniref:DUF58 domain-containing protein n=1 Tax=Halalkalibacter okhensis TaxID=333138 RepID=A0A0B0IFM5_9BACI|nr:hypothetical protein LQ50_20920 [Halalkalibacter okhensis]
MRLFVKYVFLLLFIAAAFSYAMFQGGFVSWFLFYSVITVVIATVLVAVYPFRIVKVEREIHQNVLRAGESMTVTVTLHKRALQPFFYVRVQDLIPMKLGTYDESGSLFFFSFQKRLVFSYNIRDVKRGSYSFDELSLVFGDVFGLFEREKKVSCQTEVLVYPRFHDLPSIPDDARPKQLEGRRIQRSFEEDRSLAGVRQYVAGDRITSIDWKQSARLTKLMTKEFESYQGEGVVVAFDSGAIDRNESIFEHSVELTASLMITFTEKQPGIKLAVRFTDWVSFEVTQSTISKGLIPLARVAPSKDGAPQYHKVYRDWAGMRVYYVCVGLNEQVLNVCKTLLEQGTALIVCLVAASSHDRLFITELEKLGITVFIENE